MLTREILGITNDRDELESSAYISEHFRFVVVWHTIYGCS